MSKYLDWYKSTVGHTHMQDQAKSEIEQLREQLAKANERLNNPQGLPELVCFEQMKEIPLREIHRAHQRLHEELAKANDRVEELESRCKGIAGLFDDAVDTCEDLISARRKFAIENKIEAINEALDYYEELKASEEPIGAGSMLHVCLGRLVSQEEQLRKGQE